MPNVMSKRVLYPNTNLSLNILIPCECGLTLEQIIEKDLPKHNGNTIEHVIVENDDLKIDFSFFDAYVFHPTKGYEFNSITGKEIWKNKWREIRTDVLVQLDAEFVRALESGDITKQEEIKQKKIALRDVTLIEITGSTPEEIKSIWPEILGPRPNYL